MPRLLSTLICLLPIFTGTPTAVAEPVHGIAMHGSPAEPAGFSNFSYVNAHAPKGGRLTLGAFGSFDSLNPSIIKGTSASGIRDFVIESLMTRGLNEPFTLYGLIAESVDVPPDRSSITFNINPLARFSDGKPVTAGDLLFSFELLKEKGRPNHRTYYAKVAKAERLSDLSVRFSFDSSGDREMPLILGLMPIMPKHHLTPETFDRTSFDIPVGSGPYIVEKVDPGRSIVYRRNPDYWGKDLPVNRGRFNFDEIRFEYFREGSALFEAFKSGDIDFRSEEDPARWAEGYAIPPVTDGRIIKGEFETGLPAGMTGLVFNTRRQVFVDERVRQALIHLFDFEWVNRNLFHGLYARTSSYFERSYLSSAGKPADEKERVMLAPFQKSVRLEIMDGSYRFPVSDGSGQNRANWRRALELLAAAGYQLKDGLMVEKTTGRQLAFEILASSNAQERLLGSFASDLKRLGIEARIRVVDSAQYQSRLKTYDFDMIQFTWPASLSPGNEQLFRWSSQTAKTEGSFNYAGVESPAVDATIKAMLAAATAEEFSSYVRALDRLLLSGDYVIPLFYVPRQWVAYWKHLKFPAKTPLYGYNLDTWWSER